MENEETRQNNPPPKKAIKIGGTNAVTTAYVLLLGISGSGKSTVGNIIVGSEFFKVSDTFETETKTLQEVTVQTKIDGQRYCIHVIDTPGLFGTEGKNNDQIIGDINQFLKNDRPHVNLIIFVMQKKRITPEERACFDKLLENFRNTDIPLEPHSLLVITHCENINDRDGIVTNARNTFGNAMGQGIPVLPVGFPDIKDKVILSGYQGKINEDRSQLLLKIAETSGRKFCTKQLIEKNEEQKRVQPKSVPIQAVTLQDPLPTPTNPIHTAVQGGPIVTPNPIQSLPPVGRGGSIVPPFPLPTVGRGPIVTPNPIQPLPLVGRGPIVTPNPIQSLPTVGRGGSIVPPIPLPTAVQGGPIVTPNPIQSLPTVGRGGPIVTPNPIQPLPLVGRGPIVPPTAGRGGPIVPPPIAYQGVPVVPNLTNLTLRGPTLPESGGKEPK